MNDFSDKTVYDLAVRLNQLMVEGNRLEMQMMQVNKEFNEIVQELWTRIPNLKNDVDLQPKTRVLRPAWKEDKNV